MSNQGESLKMGKPQASGHMTDPGWLLTVPGAVIKFSYFSSHPGTGML